MSLDRVFTLARSAFTSTLNLLAYLRYYYLIISPHNMYIFLSLSFHFVRKSLTQTTQLQLDPRAFHRHEFENKQPHNLRVATYVAVRSARILEIHAFRESGPAVARSWHVTTRRRINIHTSTFYVTWSVLLAKGWWLTTAARSLCLFV